MEICISIPDTTTRKTVNGKEKRSEKVLRSLQDIAFNTVELQLLRIFYYLNFHIHFLVLNQKASIYFKITLDEFDWKPLAIATYAGIFKDGCVIHFICMHIPIKSFLVVFHNRHNTSCCRRRRQHNLYTN